MTVWTDAAEAGLLDRQGERGSPFALPDQRPACLVQCSPARKLPPMPARRARVSQPSEARDLLKDGILQQNDSQLEILVQVWYSKVSSMTAGVARVKIAATSLCSRAL